jgi:FtsZ-interacting cell division protein ZipA
MHSFGRMIGQHSTEMDVAIVIAAVAIVSFLVKVLWHRSRPYCPREFETEFQRAIERTIQEEKRKHGL